MKCKYCGQRMKELLNIKTSSHGVEHQHSELTCTCRAKVRVTNRGYPRWLEPPVEEEYHEYS